MVRGWIAFAVIAAACTPDADERAVVPIAEPVKVVVDAPPVVSEAPPAWTFAVMSDLHLPNPRSRLVEKTVAALVERRVRFVVVTGDHTNGTEHDPRIAASAAWWDAVTTALRPLREAGIAVLPVAGNHDSYLAWQRDRYAAAFADLEGWASPFAIARTGTGLAAAPFTYSVDVGGVHLALIHLTSQVIDPGVAAWLERDLAAAASARHRIVFSHVPVVSVIQPPSKPLLAKLGRILERGHVDHYIAGHEHIVWDERVTLPAGGALRQVLVGCASGFYSYGPSLDSKRRAGCVPITAAGRREPMRCTMPSGGVFDLSRGRKNRHLQHYKNTLTLFTVAGDAITVQPMTIDPAGKMRPFYLAE